LLDNSLKFTNHGKVILKTSAIAYSPPKPNSIASMAKQTIRFEIKDTGVGISRDEIEKIFQPFEQASNSKKHQGSIGLGLAISKQIIHLMNSKLKVRSKLNQGSTFYFDATFWVTEMAVSYQTIKN
jgi:signal transduction histidine kinase